MKKTLALLMAAVMMISIMAACGETNAPESNSSKNQTNSNSSEESLADVDYTENETFTIWQQSDPNDYYTEYSDNPAIAYLAKKFNVTLSFEHPPAGSESDAFSLMIGTGEYTDMMDLNYLNTSLSELYEDGVVINIADYLDYMPNLKALLENNEGFARNIYDDSGRILNLKAYSTGSDLIWGGMVYRRDILETMTNGNISYPSGNEEPTTIEDWEYMLPLYKEYFESAGMENYAALILPYTGRFPYSELISGFGVGGDYYLEDGKVKYGPLEDGFYNFLSKMKEWYELGYIYKDFASRTNDPVYFPNTELTYGGASGIWYGLQSSLGDAMSMPDYGLNFDVQPLKSPVDTEHGITEAAALSRSSVDNIQGAGYAVTSACDNIPKLLSIIDYMYSEDAGLLLYGVTKEQGAAEDPILQKAGLEDGTYWFDENGKFTYNPLLNVGGGSIDYAPFQNGRFAFYKQQEYGYENSSEMLKYADEVWGTYSDSKIQNIPSGIDLGDDENAYKTNSTNINDFLNTDVAAFITGTKELNETTWEEFKNKLISYGVEDNIAYQQAAYERFLERS